MPRTTLYVAALYKGGYRQKSHNSSSFSGKGLRVSFMLYLQQVQNHANSRFTFESGKSQVSNPEDSGNPENFAQPENKNETKLREASAHAKKSSAKLDVNSLRKNQLTFSQATNQLGLSICT